MEPSCIFEGLSAPLSSTSFNATFLLANTLLFLPRLLYHCRLYTYRAMPHLSFHVCT